MPSCDGRWTSPNSLVSRVEALCCLLSKAVPFSDAVFRESRVPRIQSGNGMLDIENRPVSSTARLLLTAPSEFHDMIPHPSWTFLTLAFVTLGCAVVTCGQTFDAQTLAPAAAHTGYPLQVSDQAGPALCQCMAGCDWSSLRFFGGLEGSKQPQDFGVNANFGGRVSLEWERAVRPESGLAFQFGTALVASDNAVQVFERVAGESNRLQSYWTVGFSQELPSGLRLGAVYDLLYQDSYEHVVLSQVRTQAAFAMARGWEAGVRATIPTRGADGTFSGIPVRLDPLTQGSVFVRRYYENGSMLGGWIGLSEGHSEANLALGDLPATDQRFLFGAELRTPFNRHLALFGQANFISPADTGTVDAFLGLELLFPTRSRRLSYRHSLPFISVAGSPTFSVDLNR